MLDKIKKIREMTGAGMVSVKEALQEAGGNEEKAVEILRKKGQNKALKKSERKTREGIIVSYVHSNYKVGAIVKLFCETDFVAKNEEFRELGKDIAMHIVAMDPRYLKTEDVPSKIIEKEKEIWREQLKNKGKKNEIVDKALAGKEEKFKKEISLLSQPFVKNPDITIEQLIAEKVSKTGENIQVGDFMRYEI